MSETLHAEKRIEGKTVRELSGETEYPVYDTPEALVAEARSETPRSQPDDSAASLAALPNDCREVFEAMPIGRPVTADELCRAGFDIAQLMIAFTMLEVSGLITTLPGGLYCRI